ncbi:MAG: leucine-rich repeat protein [Saccharofermentans sp.]|nr:leucine-rich repeat protein [Saccharofermentans sp.]
MIGNKAISTNRTRLISVIISLALILLMIPCGVVRADSGNCGPGLSWSFSGGVLTISGSGDMYDYPEHLHGPDSGNELAQPWFHLKPYINSIVINEGVTSIGAGAFWGCNALTSVSIPGSVQRIGFAAFADDAALGSVSIPNGVIGEAAFIRCSGMRTVTIGPGVTASGISAFENCTGLTGVYISDVAAWCRIYFGGNKASPLEYAHNLYLNGALVTNLVIPGGVTKVGDYAFEHCMSITSVTIPEGCTTIGEYAFNNCQNITTATLPNSLKTVGSFAFASCARMHATLPGGITYIGERAFNGAPLSSNIVVNQGVIGERAFNACGSVMDLTIGAGVTYIGSNAFNEMGGLRNIHYGSTAANWNALAADSGYNKVVTYPYWRGITFGSAGASIQGARSTVNFGGYTWDVLAVSNGNALLITHEVIAFKMFSSNYSSRASMTTGWEGSSLRAWLNGAFLSSLPVDQSIIIPTSISTTPNSRFGTAGANGGAVTDKVFLLSVDEANQYFANDQQRTAVASNAALGGVGAARNGSAQSDPTTGNTYWWLRTPGMFSYSTAYVNYTGSIRLDGVESPTGALVGVRPCMWVNAAALGITGTTGGSAAAPSGANVEQISAFVDRLYAEFLGRSADDAGRQYWVNKILGGMSAVDVSAGFVFSNELRDMHLSNEEFVRRAYTVYLNREPDAAGIAYWVSFLDRGNDYGCIIHGFGESQEFTSICNSYGVTRGDYPYTYR